MYGKEDYSSDNDRNSNIDNELISESRSYDNPTYNQTNSELNADRPVFQRKKINHADVSLSNHRNARKKSKRTNKHTPSNSGDYSQPISKTLNSPYVYNSKMHIAKLTSGSQKQVTIPITSTLDYQSTNPQLILDYSNANLMSVIEAKAKEIASLEKANEKLENSAESYKKKLYEKRIDFERVKLENEILKKKLEEYDAIKDLKSNEVYKMQSIINSKEMGFAEIENLVKTTEEKFRTLEEKNIMLENENFELKKSLINLKEGLGKAKLRAEQHDIKDKGMQSTIEKLSKEIQSLNNQKKEKQAEESDRERRNYREKEGELKNFFTMEVMKLNNSLDSFKRDNDAIRGQLNEKDFIIQSIEDKKVNLEQEVRQINDKLQKEKDKSKKLTEEMQALIQEVEEQIKEKDNIINLNIETYEKEEKDAYQKILSLEKEIAILREENSKCSRQSDSLSDKHRDFMNKIEEKDEKIRQLKLQNDNLSSELSKKHNELSQIRNLEEKEVRKRQDDYNKLVQEKNELIKINLEMKSNLESAEEHIKQISEDVLQYEARMEQELSGKGSMSQEINALNSKNQELQNLTKTLQTEVYLYSNNINKLKKKYENKIQRVSL